MFKRPASEPLKEKIALKNPINPPRKQDLSREAQRQSGKACLSSETIRVSGGNAALLSQQSLPGILHPNASAQGKESKSKAPPKPGGQTSVEVQRGATANTTSLVHSRGTGESSLRIDSKEEVKRPVQVQRQSVTEPLSHEKTGFSEVRTLPAHESAQGKASKSLAPPKPGGQTSVQVQRQAAVSNTPPVHSRGTAESSLRRDSKEEVKRPVQAQRQSVTEPLSNEKTGVSDARRPPSPTSAQSKELKSLAPPKTGVHTSVEVQRMAKTNSTPPIPGSGTGQSSLRRGPKEEVKGPAQAQSYASLNVPREPNLQVGRSVSDQQFLRVSPKAGVQEPIQSERPAVLKTTPILREPIIQLSSSESEQLSVRGAPKAGVQGPVRAQALHNAAPTSDLPLANSVLRTSNVQDAERPASLQSMPRPVSANLSSQPVRAVVSPEPQRQWDQDIPSYVTLPRPRTQPKEEKKQVSNPGLKSSNPKVSGSLPETQEGYMIHKEELRCIVCMDIYETLLCARCCGTLVCKDCSSKLQRCPNCRSPAHFERDVYLDHVLSNMNLTCPCGVLVAKSKIAEHKLHCSIERFRCPAAGCQSEPIMTKAALKKHLKSTHSKAILAALIRKYPNGSIFV